MEVDQGKLFMGGISWETNEDRLKDYFETYGDVVEAVIMRDRTTGRARGFGFVVFADPAVAERVVKEKHMIDGRTVSWFGRIMWRLECIRKTQLCSPNDSCLSEPMPW